MSERESYPPSWQQVMQDYVLKEVLPLGCSKVKILYGNAGEPRNSQLNQVQHAAKQQNYYCVYLDISRCTNKLTDLVSLYHHIIQDIPVQTLCQNLQARLYAAFGYSAADLEPYQGDLLMLLVEKEHNLVTNAQKLLRQQINSLVRDLDISFSHRIFLSRLMDELAGGRIKQRESLFAWLKGEKLPQQEKTELNLFETIKKANARIWLYSLNEILCFAGLQGTVLIWDNFEAIYSEGKSPVHWTKSSRDDLYELLRQIIDDMDVLSRFLLLICTDAAFLKDEKRGAQSYHALWMRIVPGVKHSFRHNPYADLVAVPENPELTSYKEVTYEN